MMQLLCLLVCCSLHLAVFWHGAGAEESEEIDPRQLARQLRAERCVFNVSLVEEFYREHKQIDNKDYQYPDPVVYGEETYDVRSKEINWFTHSILSILQPHFDRRLSKVTLDIFTWCIHLLSTSDIYGCMNSTHRWGSPGFKALGFLDIMSMKNKSGITIYNKGQLLLDISDDLDYTVLKAALVSCTIRLPDNATVGVYRRLNLDDQLNDKHSLEHISSQSEAYLIVGKAKNFTCESYGFSINGYYWYQRDQDRQLAKVFEPNHFMLGEVVNRSTLYQLRVKDEGQSDCHFSFVQSNSFTYNDNILAFVSPTVNDTGEFRCAKLISDSDDAGQSIFISVVFTQLPPTQVTFAKGSSGKIVCEMKAPSDSDVYFTQKQVDKSECHVPFLTDTSLSDNATTLCNSTAVVYKKKDVVDDKFSMYRLELQIPEMSVNHTGEYSCTVEYTLENQTKNHVLHQYSNVFVEDIDKGAGLVKGGSSQLAGGQIAGILMGIFLFCLLIGAGIIFGLFLWVRQFKKNRHKRRKVRLCTGIKNGIFNEVSLISPGIMKPHPFEFPRSNVELQEVLGEGRFGKVYKGRARGIVPDAPNLNTVAIKTTANDHDQIHVCTQQLLSELEIMTKIQPHENICNLLASCTSPDGPLFVIMEYACHGNLKDYLEMCRQVLLQRNIALRISSEKDRPHLQQLLINCDTDGSEPNTPSEACSDVLQFTVPTLRSSAPESNKLGYDHLPPADATNNKGRDKAAAPMWSTGYDRLSALEEGDTTTSVTVVHGRASFSTHNNCSATETNSGYDHLPPADTVCEVGEEKETTMWSTGYDRLSALNERECDTLDIFSTEFSSLITNSSLCDFACQIASGLHHLESSNIIHCDLAARNILIAEGFLLKIGDFGMARCMTSDPRYQNFQSADESMIAIKWAAPEVLENEAFSFKSDVWSLATVVWEMASYGSAPFGDVTIGASLEPFIQYLKEGNRLHKPDGLSDSVYNILHSCWSVDPTSRPSASTLVECFQNLREKE